MTGYEQLVCAKCGRRVSFYLDVGGSYLSHVWPFAFHRASLNPVRGV